MYSWPAEVVGEGCLNFIFELMVMIFSGVDVEIFSSVIRWKIVEERFVAQDADIDVAVLTHVDTISIGLLQKDFNVAILQVIAFHDSFTNCTNGVLRPLIFCCLRPLLPNLQMYFPNFEPLSGLLPFLYSSTHHRKIDTEGNKYIRAPFNGLQKTTLLCKIFKINGHFMQKTAVNFDYLSTVTEVIAFSGYAQGGYRGGAIAITPPGLSD